MTKKRNLGVRGAIPADRIGRVMETADREDAVRRQRHEERQRLIEEFIELKRVEHERFGCKESFCVPDRAGGIPLSSISPSLLAVRVEELKAKYGVSVS